MRQLRSSIVLRCEYLPGSTVFAIWSHGRGRFLDHRRFRLGRDISDLAAADAVVMLEANDRVGL